MSNEFVLVTGGGGFIGGHLVKHFLDQGVKVRSVDIKPFDEWYQCYDEADNVQADGVITFLDRDNSFGDSRIRRLGP